MTILYVEDDIDDQDLFKEAILQISPAITCHVASDGDEGFELLNKLFPVPDFIFLDLRLPRMDGKTFLKLIKENSVLSSIPVIIYSTSNYSHEIDDCKELGASAFLTKATNLNAICNDLKTILYP